MILILSAITAYPIITRENPEPQALVFNHADNYDDWKAHEANAASIIRLSCSPAVQRIVKRIQNPQEMWNTLEMSLDTAASYIGRQDILCQFSACRPMEDGRLKAYFTQLSFYCIQLDHTDNTITDRNFCMQIFTSLTSQYVMILIVLKHRRLLPTPKEAMHDLLEEETTASLTKELGDESSGADCFTQCGGYHGRSCGCGVRAGRGGHCGNSGHSGSCGNRDSHESKWTYCKINSRTTDAWRKWKRAQVGRNNDECICFQCRLPGHLKVDCVSYKHIKEWWKVKKATLLQQLSLQRETVIPSDEQLVLSLPPQLQYGTFIQERHTTYGITAAASQRSKSSQFP